MSLVPYVVEQTARGERSYDIFSRLLNDRIIVLSEDVNPTSASVIIAQLLYLEGQDPEKDISCAMITLAEVGLTSSPRTIIRSFNRREKIT